MTETNTTLCCHQCHVLLRPSDIAYPHFRAIFAKEGMVRLENLPEVAERYAEHKVHGGIGYDELMAERRAFKKNLRSSQQPTQTTVAASTTTTASTPVLTGEARRQERSRLESRAFSMNVRYGITSGGLKAVVQRCLDTGIGLETAMGNQRRGERLSAARAAKHAKATVVEERAA